MEKLRASNESPSAHKLEWDAFGYYLNQIGQIPVPGREEQYEMARAVQADLAAVKAAREAADLDAMDKAKVQADKTVIKMAFPTCAWSPRLSSVIKGRWTSIYSTWSRAAISA